MDVELIQTFMLAGLVTSLVLDLLLRMRPPTLQRWFRWINNGLLFLINGVLGWLLLPGGLLAVAYWTAERQWGLLQLVQMPSWLEFVLGMLAMDFVVYIYHRAVHHFPLLWRLHRTHHTDVDVDWTTNLRQHPLDSLLLLGSLSLATILGGLTLEVVTTHYTLLFIVGLFNHANWLLPAHLDRWLRYLLVTPAMHRIHHSTWQPETDSNFGGLLPWWDWLFGTYRHAPRIGYAEMPLGLESFRKKDAQLLHRLLWNPME